MKRKFRFTWNVLSEEKREKIRQSWISLIDYLILILKTKRSDQRELSYPPLTDILQLSQRHALFSWNVEEEQEEENPVGSTQQDSTAVEDEESLTSFYWTWMKCFITRVFRREQWQEHTHTHTLINHCTVGVTDTDQSVWTEHGVTHVLTKTKHKN